jgi:hypothetical protein
VASDRGQAPPPGKGQQQGQGKKILGMPRGAVIAGVIALAAGVGWFWYKNRQSSSSSSSSAANQPNVQAGVCYDASGNVVDCSDPSAISGPVTSALQSEIQDLQGQAAQAAGQAAQQETGIGEQETDVTQLTAEEARLQKDIAALDRQEAREGRKPAPRPRPKPKPRLPRRRKGGTVPVGRPPGVITTPMQRVHNRRRA